MNRRGITLLELMFVLGISITVLAVGYRTCASVMKMDDREGRKESVMLNIQNLMARIKHDVRSAESIGASRGSLVIIDNGRRIVYTNLPAGVRRTGKGRVEYKGIKGEFSPVNGGVEVRLRNESSAYGRPIKVEFASFVRPR